MEIKKNAMVFNLLYGYHGAACHDVRVTDDGCGWVEARNSYNELMYQGKTSDFFKFMNDLSSNKFA